MSKSNPLTETTQVTDHLHRILADTYILSLKAQNYHWNVTGMHFSELHTFFEENYKELVS